MNETAAEKRSPFGITSFALHLIAMGLMLCDHLWGSFLIQYDVLTCLGRMAFPLFAFMLVEGFFHTKDRKKYARRLLIFALISEIPFNLLMARRMINPIHQNVLWTFLLGVAMMAVFEKAKKRRSRPVRLLIYAAVTLGFFLLAFVTFVDYYGHGILMVALFYFTRTERSDPPVRRIAMGLVQVAVLYWISCELIAGMMLEFSLFGSTFFFYKQAFSLFALPIIWLYNGRQGLYNRAIRALYYWFYPVHMAILGGLLVLL